MVGHRREHRVDACSWSRSQTDWSCSRWVPTRSLSLSLFVCLCSPAATTYQYLYIGWRLLNRLHNCCLPACSPDIYWGLGCSQIIVNNWLFGFGHKLFVSAYTIVDYKLQQYFSLPPNQPAILLAYNPRSFQTKRTCC